MSRNNERKEGKRPVTAENFGDSLFQIWIQSVCLRLLLFQRQANRGSQRLKSGWAENDWRSEGKKRSRGKTVTTIAGFLPGELKDAMSLLKRMKTSLGTGGTWNGSCMELQGDKRSEVVHWLSSLGFKPILAGG